MPGWFIEKDGEALGPISFNRLKILAGFGTLKATDTVRNGDNIPLLAGKVPDLFEEDDELEQTKADFDELWEKYGL